MIFQAITTRYVAAGYSTPARIIASNPDGKRYVLKAQEAGDAALSSVQAHKRAAQALCDKMKWTGRLATGGLANGNYVHVFVEEA